MPERNPPRRLPGILHLFTTARNTWQITTKPSERALSVAQWEELDPAAPGGLCNRLLVAQGGVRVAMARQCNITAQLNVVADRLAMNVSHFHQVLDLGIARGDFSASARAYYHRDLRATTIPDLSTHNAIAEAAAYIVRGEPDRQAAEGTAFVAMALPSAAQVGALLAQFKTLREQSLVALSATNAAREVVSGQLPAARALAVDICDTVEFFYRKDPDASSRRDKCARWGVVYLHKSRKKPVPAPA